MFVRGDNHFKTHDIFRNSCLLKKLRDGDSGDWLLDAELNNLKYKTVLPHIFSLPGYLLRLVMQMSIPAAEFI